jgi:hypothetical protein
MKASIAVAFLALSLFCTTVAAEGWAIGKGATHWTGSFALSYSGGDLYENAKNESQTFAAFTISGLHFLVPHFAAGLGASFAHFEQGSTNAFMAAIGPWAGIYVGSRQMHSYPYLKAGYEYMQGAYDDDTHGHSWNIGVGVLSMLSAKLGLAVELRYSVITLTAKKHAYAFDLDGGPLLGRVDGTKSGHMIGFTIGLLGASF